MKSIILLITFILASTSFANIDMGDVKKDTRKAKSAFNQMVASNPSLAQMEESFTVKGGLTYFPGVGFYSLRNVCQTGNSVQTTQPVSKCIEWSVNFEDKEGDKSTESFDNLHDAKMASNESDALGNEYCSSKSAPAIATSPKIYQGASCVEWSVKFKDKDGDIWTQKYGNHQEASKAARGKDATSKAKCSDIAQVNKAVQTSINLKVYRTRKGSSEKNHLEEDDSDLQVGNWVYTAPSCGDDTLPPVMAN